jgi:hypothetical protein
MIMNFIHIIFSLLISLSGWQQQQSQRLFDGVKLGNWQITDMEGKGKVKIADSCLILNQGTFMTGINWVGEFPLTDYEVSLEAKRVEGSDFFCGMTFPVKGSFCTFVIGGWGGSLVGLSNIDGFDAANNFTGRVYRFQDNRWYKIRLRVTSKKIEGWIDGQKQIDVPINDYIFSVRWEVEQSIPFGFATYKTTGALRRITLTPVN